MHFFLNRKWKNQNPLMEKNLPSLEKKMTPSHQHHSYHYPNQQIEMTSTQLPSNIALNIWEDSIKMEADTILCNINKMKYDDVLRQLKYIIPLEDEEDDEWFYWNLCWSADTSYNYRIPLLCDPEVREEDFDDEYFYCRVSKRRDELLPRGYNTGIYHLTRGLVFDVYDYDTDNDRNDEDLKLIKDRIASILQKSINLVEDDESDYEYEDDFFAM